MNEEQEKTVWRDMEYSKKFLNAFRGVRIFVETTSNLFIHILLALLTILFGFYFGISSTEWLFLIIAIGFVLVTEAINTAIEIDIDLTSPQYHPFARDTKDVAAGAVLLSAFFAVIVALVIFLPKLLSLF